ncbi:MAG: 23S rRNA (uracil(1939)-C(5))-methyltransferase RlmD [Melioribacteraceae bacterium]|nr:MAG: 23S rRNA (uracil(1939)-C(5))-methyltransferase RlmD [Melioribacteraceae bacterium]
MKKGDILELEITGYAFEGKGIAKIHRDDSEKKYVIFADGSYPGDKVKVELRRIKKSYAESKVIEVIEPSEERTRARCNYFGICGGCKQQDLKYEIQLKYKAEQVKDVFERIGGLKDFEMLTIVPSQKVFYYRNKMEFSFADKRWLFPEEINNRDEIKDQNFALGLHIPRMFDKVLDINECYLQSEDSTKILNFTRDFFKSTGTSIYSTKTHEGYLRNLVIKQSHHTNDLMVNLVTSKLDEQLFTKYAEELLKIEPKITTIVNNINEKKAQIAVGDFERIFHGNGVIFDKIGQFLFRISPNSFFQTNSIQAENLYETALAFAEFSGDEIVYDLYSGAGTISIFVSPHVKQVYAFESVEAAVKDAASNTELNKITNVHFELADLNKSFLTIIEEKLLPKPDVVITDPPRAGMNPKTINDVIELSPKKIVYVSCNPATQARDIKMLVESGYKLIKIRPVDMFPHTFHIENVALLVKV